MTLKEWVKSKALKMMKVEKLSGSPNDNRLTFISDEDAIRVENVRANKVWYYGDGDELLNYYTNQAVYGWMSNPIYNRNRRNYFWGLSSAETDIKRIHSGLPKALIDSTTNIVGKPTITCDDSRIDKIFKKNNFMFRLTQEFRPLTLVEGDGCLKINVDPKLSNVPLIEYYEAEDWEPIVKSQVVLGYIFKSYYKDKKGQNYVLNEIRQLVDEGCLIEYKLFKLEKNNYITKADFKEIPELAGFKDNDRQLISVHKLFAIPMKYYFNPLYKNRGKSLFEGKIDFFDMLDEIWSQASQTNRVSTPVEYYDVSLLQRTKNGTPILPSKYNRQYVAKNGSVDGDGNTKEAGIVTTQPELNFDKYGMLASDVLSNILTGWLSPSSLGIDVAKKDNADAQREKEKQTIFTRNTIIDQETMILEELINQLLMMQDYIDTGSMKEIEHEITITYDEFANPSFESELQVLGPAWSQGQISTEQYVKLLWAGKMSDEEMQLEVQKLDEARQADNIDMESLMNENGISQGLPGQARPEEEIIETQE